MIPIRSTKTFNKINSLPASDLLMMGDRSAEMAKKITPDTWAQTFMNFITKQ